MGEIAFVASVIAPIYLGIALLRFARRKPKYSHIRHTISELGEIGAPDQRWVGLGVFLPVGVLLSVVAFAGEFDVLPQATLALCIAAGYLVAAFFPCDPGSPLQGSVRQSMHNVGGAIEYVGATVSLLRLAELEGQPFQGAAMVVGGAAILLSFAHPFRGLV